MKSLRIAGTVVGVVLSVIGLASLPDDLTTWAGWLDPLKGERGRWLFVIVGVSIVIAANLLPRLRRSPPTMTTFTPTSGIRVQPSADPVFAPRYESQVAAMRREAVIDQLTQSADRKEAALLFREAFDSYVEAFLARRRELKGITPERLGEVREEYGSRQRAVVRAYRGIREQFRAFVDDEPGYDLRAEMSQESAYELPVDYPLTWWWKSLTFDEAVHEWSNAHDAHIEGILERQRAVLDAFAD